MSYQHQRKTSKPSESSSSADRQERQSGPPHLPRRVSASRQAWSRTNTGPKPPGPLSRSSSNLSLSRTPSAGQTGRITMRYPEIIKRDNMLPALRPVNRDRSNPSQKLVFLAGGMGGDVDWRGELHSYLQKETRSGMKLCDTVLINPNFDAESRGMQRALTKWETFGFEKSHIVVFWFHKYTPCVVSLLEFGTWGMPYGQPPKGYEVIVGADPEYARRKTLEDRCQGKYTLYSSLESLMEATACELTSYEYV